MNRTFIVGLGIALLTSGAGYAQTSFTASSETLPPSAPDTRPAPRTPSDGVAPFSRMAFGVGVSPLGVGMEVSTDINQHLNLRASGNVFKYNTTFNVDGFPVTAGLNLGSAGIAADYYPFHVGWRLTAGMLFVNDNQMSATITAQSGNNITINGTTYYSANTNAATGATPLSGTGALNLNGVKPGAVLTTGWGNHVKRSGHWAFPFEVGAAFVGTPSVAVNLSGWACTDAAQTQCTNIADPQNPIAQKFQSDLQAQIAKWNKDINVLQAYPVLSFGVAYSFRVRK